MTHAGGPPGPDSRLGVVQGSAAVQQPPAAMARARKGRAKDTPPPLSVSPAFEALRLNILGLLPHVAREASPAAAPASDMAPVIGLLSGTRGEGVSTVTAGLAAAIARASGQAEPGLGSGPVLVIDATGETTSRDGPAQGGLAALGPRQTTLAEVGSTVLPGRLTRCPQAGVDLLTLGGAEARDAFAYDGRWRDVLNGLRAAYACVLVDCGSLQGPVPSLWVPWTTLAILVIDSERTSEFRLHQTRRVLETRHIPIHGTVLNRRPYPIPSFLYRFFA